MDALMELARVRFGALNRARRELDGALHRRDACKVEQADRALKAAQEAFLRAVLAYTARAEREERQAEVDAACGECGAGPHQLCDPVCGVDDEC